MNKLKVALVLCMKCSFIITNVLYCAISNLYNSELGTVKLNGINKTD